MMTEAARKLRLMSLAEQDRKVAIETRRLYCFVVSCHSATEPETVVSKVKTGL